MSPQPAPKLEIDVPEIVRINEQARLRLRFANSLKYARIVFRFDAERMLLTGLGKDLDGEECEFLFRFLAEDSREIELEIWIPGKLESSFDLPIEIFMSDSPRRRPSFVKSVVIKLEAPALTTRARLLGRISKGFNAVIASGPKLLGLITTIIVVLVFRNLLADEKNYRLNPPMEENWEFRADSTKLLSKEWVGAGDSKPTKVGTKGTYGIQDVLVLNGSQPRGITFKHPFYDGIIHLRLWNPVGAGWTLRAQQDRRLGYSFYVARSSAGKLVLKARTSYRPFLSRNIVNENYDKDLEMPFSDCCDERDAFEIKITLDRFKIRHDVRYERFDFKPPTKEDVKNIECPAPCSVSVDFSDDSGHFRFGNLSLFVEDPNKTVWLENLSVYPKDVPTFLQRLQSFIKDAYGK